MANPDYGEQELFDICIYANDVDPGEHQINVIVTDVSSTELGIIAGGDNEAGNREDKGFLLQSFSFDEYINGGNEIKIEVFNFEKR